MHALSRTDAILSALHFAEWWRNGPAHRPRQQLSRMGKPSGLHHDNCFQEAVQLTESAVRIGMERTGLEPVTPCLQSRCSPN